MYFSTRLAYARMVYMRKAAPKPMSSSTKFGFWAVLILLVLMIVSWVVSEFRRSVVFRSEEQRFYMVVAGRSGQVVFTSFDPAENKIVLMPLPEDLYIKSRSVGEYKVGNLFELGNLEDKGGVFLSRKVQGFLRTPILGYVVLDDSEDWNPKKLLSQGLWQSLLPLGGEEGNLSRLDALSLLLRTGSYRSVVLDQSELVRSGVLESRAAGGFTYNYDRLRMFAKERFFDWLIGDEGITVSVNNLSGVDGLGGDVGEFLQTIGADVVMVKEEKKDAKEPKTSILVANEVVRRSRTVRFLERIFEIKAELGETSTYRADVVFFVGQDMTNMF